MNCVNIIDGSLQTKDAQQTRGEKLTVSANVHNKDTHASRASVSSTGPPVIKQ